MAPKRKTTSKPKAIRSSPLNVPTSYVVTCDGKQKISCDFQSPTMLFLEANCKFCENLDNVNLDQVVIFETGDLLESNAQLHKYRYYMYLKPGEKWTKKSLKDAKKMEVKWNPKPRPDKPERPRPEISEEILDIYCDLAKGDKWLREEAWTYDKKTLAAMEDAHIDDVEEKLRDRVDDVDVLIDIMTTAMKKHAEMNEATRKKKYR